MCIRDSKKLEDNFEIIRELKQIRAMGFPVLIGPSRKSFIGDTLNLPTDDRLEGTMAALTAITSRSRGES